MKVMDSAYESVAAHFYKREERLDRAEQSKGADPRTEQTTTREPDGGQLAELRRAKS